MVDELKSWGRDGVLALFRATLERLRVPFDVWKSEATLYERRQASTAAFAARWARRWPRWTPRVMLRESEGAVWLRTTRYGDDKDRVLIRQTGEPTYFLSDIAYHRDKLDRGFEHLIDIWGADHHGYVPRMKAAFTALPPHDPDKLELIIGQLVNLMESGAAKRMSKRRGDIVTVDDLVEAIGVDATRFFMVGRSHDSTLDLDLDLAVEQSSKNPVYYVQYAHARICQHPAEPGRRRRRPAPATALPPVEVAASRARPAAGAGALPARHTGCRRTPGAAQAAQLPGRAGGRVPRLLQAPAACWTTTRPWPLSDGALPCRQGRPGLGLAAARGRARRRDVDAGATPAARPDASADAASDAEALVGDAPELFHLPGASSGSRPRS